jgi:hypothetical protein
MSGIVKTTASRVAATLPTVALLNVFIILSGHGFHGHLHEPSQPSEARASTYYSPFPRVEIALAQRQTIHIILEGYPSTRLLLKSKLHLLLESDFGLRLRFAGVDSVIVRTPE